MKRCFQSLLLQICCIWERQVRLENLLYRLKFIGSGDYILLAINKCILIMYSGTHVRGINRSYAISSPLFRHPFMQLIHHGFHCSKSARHVNLSRLSSLMAIDVKVAVWTAFQITGLHWPVLKTRRLRVRHRFTYNP